MSSINERAQKIKCVICDLDGVLTDGLLYLDNYENELKTFHIHDGVGLKLLMAAAIDVAVITGSHNAVVDRRMGQLGIKHYFKNQLNKSTAFEQIKSLLLLKNDDIAYIGDDIPDLSIIKQVGLGVAVANATPLVKETAHWITSKTGGYGAVRELCDFILRAQNKMDHAIKRYLEE